MKILILSLFISIILTVTNTAQIQLEKDDIKNLKIISTEYYNGESLWGLINGGADLYLEYGFEKLTFQKVEWKNINFRIEIYEMSDPNAAYGIYSINKYKCVNKKLDTEFSCVTPYQVQAAKGSYYLSVTNEIGDSDTQQLAIMIANELLNNILEKYLELPDYFNDPKFKNDLVNLKIIRGRLGIQNGFTEWENLFDDQSNYELFVLTRNNKNSTGKITVVRFSSDRYFKKFLENRNTNGLDLSISVINKKEKVILIKSQS